MSGSHRRLVSVAMLVLGLSLASTTAFAQAELAQAIDRAATELSRVSSERDRMDAELEGVGEQRDRAEARMQTRLRALYRMRRAGVLPLAGGFDALLTHQSRVQRLERMVVRDVGAVRDLRRRSEALSTEAARLADDARRSEQVVTELRERQEAESQQLNQLSMMIQDPASFYSTESFGGLRVAGQSPSAAPTFADERGRLPLPVAGSARVADATREGGEGLALTATPGVTVRSVYTGRVAYAADHPAYGRLVIVDHNDEHYTVYGGLGAIGVRVGQMVNGDSVLGTVGAQPMFFQVRRGSRPLEARAWIGI